MRCAADEGGPPARAVQAGHLHAVCGADKGGGDPACAQCEGFNGGKWVALGDEEGYVSILDGTSPLPAELCPAEPDAPRPTAQWLAHHNAIFDLAWCQARAPSRPRHVLCAVAACGKRTRGLRTAMPAKPVTVGRHPAAAVCEGLADPVCP